MIKFYKLTQIAKIASCIAASVFMFFAQDALAFPGGTYTIDRNAASSATNYRSFTALANDLRNINRGDTGANNYAIGGAGVQGTIIVNVVSGSGPYTERFQVNQILGASSARRVIINGNGNTIQYTATAVNQATIEMDGTDFFTFNDLTIIATEQSSVGGKNIWMYNSANFNVIKRCNLRRTFANTSQGSAYIWMNQSTSTSPFTYGDAANDNLIDSCDLSSPGNTTWGAFYGIIMFGPTGRSTGNATNRNTVSNCNIQNFWQRGIYFNYCGGITIRKNNIHNTNSTRSTTVYGIQGDYSDFDVDQNRIYNLNGNTPTANQQFGVYFFSFASGNWVFNRSRYTNNVVHQFGTGTLYGSYFYVYGFYGHVLDIVGNTHSISHPTATNNTQCFPMYGGYWQGLFDNNILHFDMAGTTGMKQLMYDFFPTNANYRNNNWSFGPLANNQTQKFFGPQYQTNANMQDMYNVGIPTNNLGFDPEFVDFGPNSLLIPNSIPMANKARVTTFTRDVTNATRSTTPDIGAYEYSVDLAITAFPITFPTPTCAGHTSTISGTVRNNGLYAIRNPRISYQVTGSAPVSQTFPITINSGASANITFTNPHVFARNGNNTITLRIADPDDVPSNDAMSVNFFVTPAPGGSTFSKNTTLSSPSAEFIVSGKPDLTFPNERFVYDVTAPSRVGYNNSQYGSLWSASVTARKESDNSSANSFFSLDPASSSNDMRVNFNPIKSLENETIEVSINILNIATNCDTTYIRRIFIAPKATPKFKLPAIVCEKTEIYFENLSEVSSGSIESFWDFGDGSPITDEASPVHTYANFGSYTVKLITKTNPYGFSTDTTFTLNITEVPQALILNTNACENVAIRLRNGTIYGGTGLTTYTWDYGDNTGTNVNNRNDLFKTYAAPGGYLVKLVATADGCSNSTQKFVYQFARPVANFTKDAGVCLNSEFKFSNQSTITQGLFGNEWDFNDAGNKATLKEPTYIFQSAGMKNVTLKVISEFGCEDSRTIPVEVKQIPTTDFTFPFACSRTATPFVNNTNLNGQTLNSYLWNFGDGFTSSATAPTKNWTSVGPKLVSLTTTLTNGCSSIQTKEVNVGVQPNVNFNVLDHCSGSEVPFSNLTTYDQGQISYTWSFGDGITSSISAPIHAYPASNTSQTFTVQLKAAIAGGCSDSLSKTIEVNPLPGTCTFDIEGSTGAALSIPYNFVPKTGSTSGIEYTWLPGDGSSINTTGTGATHKFNAPGKYCVTMIARDINTGCECTSVKCVTLTTNINSAESMNNAVSIYPNPNSGIFNVTLDSEINGEMTVLVYNTIGELIKTIVVNDNQTNVDLSDVASGVYTVKVMADNQIATKKITVTK
ncbi:MAG: PKD domain-containing protein [Bacteroidota bacterium]|nr:PKD domain-containing protein [Bacteroidota bacterium]